MKSFRQVEENRRAYHRDPTLNSVHRASLLVPEIEGARAEISFLNHFLIKRGYERVGCRITAIGPTGQRISAQMHLVKEPRVYRIPLTGTVEAPVASWLVEFFAAENLFFPFPAVMINHIAPRWLNTVHAYNRILNDVFEDDAINARHVAEASIDVRMDDRHDTILMFTAGPARCAGDLEIELQANGKTLKAHHALDVARMCHEHVSLKSVFPAVGNVANGVLRIRQPQQAMFYGRLFTGQVDADGTLAANHSFYDNSTVAEYWDNTAEAVRHYPMFDGLHALVRFYPIMAPGALDVAVELFDAEGRQVAATEAGRIESPNGDWLEFDVSKLAEEEGVAARACAFAVRVRPLEGNTPMRVAHQVVYRDAGNDQALEASINLGLANANVYIPDDKTSLAWGQVPMAPDIESWLGFVWNHPHEAGDEVHIRLYDTTGLIAEETRKLNGRSGVVLSPADLDRIAGKAATFEPVWYEARTSRPDLAAFSVARHRVSRACSGEHNF
jgi:hypothetical protein